MKILWDRNSGIKPGRAFLFVASTTLLLSGVPTAVAQTTDFDRFSVSLGAFFANRDTQTRLEGEVPGSGTDVDLESDLGLAKSDSVFRIDGYYRFSEKHRIDFSAFDLSRSGSKQLEADIEWDGVTYPVDALIKANLDLGIYKLAYTWSFMQQEKGYLGVSVGAYVADISSSISADELGRASKGGLTAPLPVLGLRGQYDLSDKWSLRGSAEVFAFEYGDFSGSLYDLYAGIDYQLVEHVALGVGFNSVRLDVGVTKTHFNGDLNWRYDGALVFFKFDF